MELTLILVPIFVFVLLKMLLDQRAAARSENLRLLEEALKNPALDRTTIESLTYQLTGARPPQQRRPTALTAVVLAIGWITLFTGIGVMMIGGVVDDEDAVAAGALVSMVGFGLVTYPFALRELEARRGAQ
jgi:hypothetical protein